MVNTAAVLAAVYMVPGIRFKDDSLWTPFVTSLVLGILNAFIRPILMVLALPLLIFTLGLFTLVINALLLTFVSFLLGRHFEVDSFGAAFLGALVISIVSLVLNLIDPKVKGKRDFAFDDGIEYLESIGATFLGNGGMQIFKRPRDTSTFKDMLVKNPEDKVNSVRQNHIEDVAVFAKRPMDLKPKGVVKLDGAPSLFGDED